MSDQGPQEPWTLAELIDVLDVTRLDDDRFRGETIPLRLSGGGASERTVVDGSQLLGQAIVAAVRREPGRVVKSAHMIFARAASSEAPVDFEIDSLHSGRNFASLSVEVRQAERSCARALILLDGDAEDLVRRVEEAPSLPGPDQCEPFALGTIGRDVRFVEGTDYVEPDKIGPPTLDVWVQFAECPKELALCQALLAQMCGPLLIGVAMRPHPGLGESDAHRSLSTGVLTITLHFHDPGPVDDWFLFRHESVHVGRGLCDGIGRIYKSGKLVASFRQEGLLRSMPASATGLERTKLL
jgi:acyl-CoA thioesterase